MREPLTIIDCARSRGPTRRGRRDTQVDEPAPPGVTRCTAECRTTKLRGPIRRRDRTPLQGEGLDSHRAAASASVLENEE
jgi:hypothetical protein